MSSHDPAVDGVALRRLNAEDEPAVAALLDRLQAYSHRVDGVPQWPGAANRFLTGLPPRRLPAHKLDFAVVAHGEDVGLVDLVSGWPASGTVHIGLLAIAEDRHKEGLGRAAFAMVEAFARDELAAPRLRIAVVDSNPVLGFWQRMGFSATGETRPYQGIAVQSTSRILVKELSRED